MNGIEYTLVKKTTFIAITGYEVFLQGELIGDFSMYGEWGQSFPMLLADRRYYYNGSAVCCVVKGDTTFWSIKRNGFLSPFRIAYNSTYGDLRYDHGNVYSADGKRLTRYYPAARFCSKVSRVVVSDGNLDFLYFSLLSLGKVQSTS